MIAVRVGRRAVAVLSAGLAWLAVRAAERPRRMFAGVLAAVTFVLVMTPAAPASAAPGSLCDWGGLSNVVCTAGKTVIEKIPGVGGLVKSAASATKAVDALSPSNFLDTWAQGLCHAVIFTLTFIESTAEKLGTPAFNQQWWADQYAVSFGLSLILLAFLLAVVAAKAGGPEGSISGIELLRQSGWRMVFVVPACALGPAVLYSLQQVAAALTKTFATQAAVQANGAVGGLLKAIQDAAGKGWGGLGGTVMVIVLMVPILLCGVVLMVEMAIANWGMMLTGLLVPLALVAAVYPPWARILRRLCGIILGMMFIPVVTFFFFWTVWSAFNSNINGQGGSNSTITMLIFLLVSLLMIDAFPIVAVWLMGIVAPGTEQMDPSVRASAPQPTTGDVYERTFAKLEPRSWNGGGGGPVGGDGGEPAGHDDAGGGDGEPGPDDADGGTSGGDGGPDSSSAESRHSVPLPDDSLEEGTRAGSGAGDGHGGRSSGADDGDGDSGGGSDGGGTGGGSGRGPRGGGGSGRGPRGGGGSSGGGVVSEAEAVGGDAAAAAAL